MIKKQQSGFSRTQNIVKLFVSKWAHLCTCADRTVDHL